MNMNGWQKRYDEMLFQAEKKHHDKELKVERKKAETDLASQRREELVNKKLNVSCTSFLSQEKGHFLTKHMHVVTKTED